MPHLKDICIGCPKHRMWYGCSVYKEIPSYYIRQAQCPINIKAKSVSKRKVRVGQQKTRRVRG